MKSTVLTKCAAACAAALAAFMMTAAPAAAEDWPTHPVRIINTFAPGGAADILARMAADQLTKALGQQFYVETRAGAGGVIGVDAVAHSDPDGYNFVITTLSLTAINPLINSKIGYNPFKDLNSRRISRGIADRFHREREEPGEDAEGLCRQVQGQFKAADLWRLRTGERRTDGG